VRPFAGVSGNAYLLLSSSPAECLARLESLCRYDDSAFLLLTPSRSFGRAEFEGLPQPRRFDHLSLAEAVRGSGRRFELTESGSNALSRYTARIAPAAADNPDWFPTPPDAVWSELTVRFLDGHSVRVSLRGETRVLNFTQLGMNDRRTAKPDVQWELLRAFAAHSGTLDWTSREAVRENKKRKQVLSDRLRTFFRIDGNPILFADGGGYRTVFRVENDS
jgi:hypothetical protein